MRYLRVGMILSFALLVAILFLAGPATIGANAEATVTIKDKAYAQLNDTTDKDKLISWTVSGIPDEPDDDPGKYNYTVYYGRYNATGVLQAPGWQELVSSTTEGNVKSYTWSTEFVADSWYYKVKISIHNDTGDIYGNATSLYFPIENNADQAPSATIVSITNPNTVDIEAEADIADRVAWWNTSVAWTASDADYGDNITTEAYVSMKGEDDTWGTYMALENFGSSATMSFSSSLDSGTYVWNVSAFEPGYYKFKLRVTDSTGSIAEAYSQEFYIDGFQAPIVDVLQVPAIPDVGENVTFTVIATDPNHYGSIIAYRFNPGVEGVLPVWTSSSTYTYQYPNTGTYTFVITVLDDDGETTKISTPVSIQNIKPEVSYIYSFDLSQGNKTYSEATFTSTSTDPYGTVNYTSWYFSDPHSPAIDNFQTGEEVTHTFTRPGTYTVRLTVRDDEGMYNETTFEVSVDNRPPEIDIDYIPVGFRNATLDFISNSIDRDGEIVATLWTVDGNETFEGNTLSYQFTEKKVYPVELSVYDGTVYTNQTYNVTILNLDPTMEIWADGPSYIANNETVWVATLGEELIIRPRYWDYDGLIDHQDWVINATGSSYSYLNGKEALAITFSNHGTYSFKVTVYDDDGAWVNETFDVFVNRKPVADIDSTISANLMEYVKFSPVNSTDPDGASDIVKYFWHFGDGSTAEMEYNANETNIVQKYDWSYTDPEGTTHNGFNVFHYYRNSAIYEIYLTVTDRFGATNTTSWSVLIPPQSDKVTLISWYVPLPEGSTSQPTVFSGDDEGEASITNDVFFNLTLLENLTGDLSFRWDFGDNSIGMGNNITHTFSITGEITVKLIVYVDGEPKFFDYIFVTIHDVPKIVIDYKPYWKVYLAAGFDATPTIKDEGNIIVKYIWDFGDGSTVYESTSATATHIYTINGTYLVELTVIDGRGAIASKRVPITIKNRTDSILESPGMEGVAAVTSFLAVSIILFRKRHSRYL